jgi:hypothetical protein
MQLSHQSDKMMMPQDISFNQIDQLKDATSVLSDGSVIRRVYLSDALENKRVAALNVMGSKWIMHPSNHVKCK